MWASHLLRMEMQNGTVILENRLPIPYEVKHTHIL